MGEAIAASVGDLDLDMIGAGRKLCAADQQGVTGQHEFAVIGAVGRRRTVGHQRVSKHVARRCIGGRQRANHTVDGDGGRSGRQRQRGRRMGIDCGSEEGRGVGCAGVAGGVGYLQGCGHCACDHFGAGAGDDEARGAGRGRSVVGPSAERHAVNGAAGGQRVGAVAVIGVGGNRCDNSIAKLVGGFVQRDTGDHRGGNIDGVALVAGVSAR